MIRQGPRKGISSAKREQWNWESGSDARNLVRIGNVSVSWLDVRGGCHVASRVDADDRVHRGPTGIFGLWLNRSGPMFLDFVGASLALSYQALN